MYAYTSGSGFDGILQSVVMSSTRLWSNVVTSVSGGGSGSYAWQTDYDANVDSYNMGQTYGAPRKSLSGGNWTNANICGSRSMYCNLHPYELGDMTTTRGCNKAAHLPN